MPIFEYKALDQNGKSRKGLIDSDTEDQARARLRNQGLFPVSFKEGRTKSSSKSISLHLSSFHRITSEEIGVVTRQLATLIDAGIPLISAITSLVEQTENSSLKRVLVQIRDSVNEGATLTDALREHGQLFSEVYINMVRAGEASGSLGVVLEKLADFSEKQEAIKSQIKTALFYPVFMALVGVGILFILLTYVVPNIIQVFAEMDQALPAPTRFLINSSSFLQQYWWGVLLFILLLFLLVKYLIRQSAGRVVWDHLKLRFPVVGSVSRKIILARFAATLGSLLESGVDLMNALKIVKALMNNVKISEVLDEAIEDIEQGRSMTLVLSKSSWFPSMFVQMVSVGEQSGNLEKMLRKVASAYEREVESALKGLTSLIEPLMIVVMGGVVGFIVLSILLPIFEMNQFVG